MKKPAFILIAAALVLSLSGCGTVPTGKPVTVSKPASSSTPASAASSSTPASSQNSESSKLTYNYKNPIFGDIEQKYEIENPKTYFDKYFDFSVDYPAGWSFKEGPFHEATASSEGSPDHSIHIYVEGNKNNEITIGGQFGQCHTEMFDIKDQGDFITNDLLKGRIGYKSDANGLNITVYIFESTSQQEVKQSQHYANVHVSNVCFDRNKAQILGVLKSIKVYTECRG